MKRDDGNGPVMMDVNRGPRAPTTSPPPLPHQSSLAWLWLLLGILLLAGGGYYVYTRLHASTANKGAGPPPARDVPVVVAQARRGDLSIYLSGLGSVQSLNTVTLHTRVDGQLNKVAFVEGQLVHKDDPLAEIDPRPYQVQLTQAEGQLAKDQALFDNAKADLDRYEKAGDSISKARRIRSGSRRTSA